MNEEPKPSHLACASLCVASAMIVAGALVSLGLAWLLEVIFGG